MLLYHLYMKKIPVASMRATQLCDVLSPRGWRPSRKTLFRCKGTAQTWNKFTITTWKCSRALIGYKTHICLIYCQLSALMRLPLSTLCDERMECEWECCGCNHFMEASTITHCSRSIRSGFHWGPLLLTSPGSGMMYWFQARRHGRMLC